MKKNLLFLLLCFTLIGCGKKEPDYPILTKSEKREMYRKAKENNDQEALNKIFKLKDQLEILGKKGDEVAQNEYDDWHEVIVMYIPRRH